MFARLIFLVVVVVACGVSASAQRGKPFQGEWEWAVYARSKAELPPAYRQERLQDVPNAAIYLKLKQRGNKLTGEYSASRRFLARLEEGELDCVIKGKTARLELQSGFGGNVTVCSRCTAIGCTGRRLSPKVNTIFRTMCFFVEWCEEETGEITVGPPGEMKSVPPRGSGWVSMHF